MPELQEGRFNPAMIPLLLMLSTKPDVETRLSELASFIEATQNALKNIRSGMETLHATMIQLSTTLPANSPPKPDPAPPDKVNFPNIKLPPNKQKP